MAVGAPSPLAGKTVFVAGHRGLVGSAIVRRLAREGCRVLTASRAELDLLRQADVEAWLQRHRPQIMFIAAGKVGGILANSVAPADFLYENVMINANLLAAAHRIGCEKVVVLGSSCIYPREAPQPIPESALLTGPLEPTNEGYAIAKIAAVKMAQAYARQYGDPFVSLMPSNLYGPNDNFDLETSHVLPALVRKFSDARRLGAATVTVWGSGTPMREFLHADDLADACLFAARHCHGGEILNVGSQEELSIRALAELVARITGFRGEIVYDRSMPDGTPRKKLDTSALAALGWRARIPLAEGVQQLHENWLQRAVAENAV
ncbi:NAD-dependent epimerase/dehydratase family protein [Paracoccus sp. S-4012]|nr:NAD-dependent epimerase/dehydratase family protein [Paracoccus sp. S-4012]